ncbi:homoserine kinase [Cytobacillus purgationiresistens]|uniref:Homoserine kinase n=1 Tax=Cytobacillus purgationiresistens TaxID=863449 RepID=A0ABU0AQL2_9BACI|nr:homoserine kinase [Cytobacillus purgationiresistens]MDQ0273067.1 homoserine kinase [Cytobacillus purgationiresistens]
MIGGERLIIEVPASTANLGPGFDSIGLALNLYLRMEVVKQDQWEVIPMTEELSMYPSDKKNFIIQTAIETAKEFQAEIPPCQVIIDSDIPIARGLGSSASAIVAGIELADALCELHLSKQEKLRVAAMFEGHPDNVGASLMGGLVIGNQSKTDVDAVVFRELEVEVIACIPSTELLTKESRGLLPEHLSFKDAVQAGAVGNVMIASLLSGNYELAGKMMMQDLYHHPYRKQVVPHLEEIEKLAPSLGALGVALSGAGPTVLCLVAPGRGLEVAQGLAVEMPHMKFNCLHIDQVGSRVYKKNMNVTC